MVNIRSEPSAMSDRCIYKKLSSGSVISIVQGGAVMHMQAYSVVQNCLELFLGVGE